MSVTESKQTNTSKYSILEMLLGQFEYLQKYPCIWMHVAQIALCRKGLHLSERLHGPPENQGKNLAKENIT